MLFTMLQYTLYQVVYCHPAYSIYMWSTSYKMPGWMKQKFAGRNIKNLRYADDATLMAENEEKLKSHLMKLKEESEKACFKFNIQKMKIMASGPNTLWQTGGETRKQ